jgi:hypothetical protein
MSNYFLRARQTPEARATVTVYLPSWRWPGSGDGVICASRLSSAGASKFSLSRF